MKWINSGKYVSDKNSFVWDKWFKLLVSESGRSLFSIHVSSSPSPTHYGLLGDISKDGLNIILSFRHKTVSIGVGLVE